MGSHKYNWISALRNLPHADPFVDSRIIHAPAPVVQCLLNDFKARSGPPKPPSYSGQRILPTRIRDALRLLWKGQPQLLDCAVETVSPGTARLRLRPGYAPRAEFTLAAGAIGLWVAVWLVWAWLIMIRDQLLPGGTHGQLGPLVPVLIFAGLWLFGFSRIWATAFRPGPLVDRFYEYLTHECGVAHVSDAPLRFAWSGFLQIIITGIGLLGVCAELSAMVGPRDRVILFGVLAIPYAFVLFNLWSVKSSVRWLTGKAAFATTVALALYLLFPTILWAFEAESLSQNASVSGPMKGGNDRLFIQIFAVLLGFGASVLVLAKVTREAAVYARAIDYWQSHPESQRWENGGARLFLFLLVLVAGFLAGGLFWVAFKHCVLHGLSLVLGNWPSGVSVAFERASHLVGTLVGRGLETLGMKAASTALGSWLMLALSIPVLAWGSCHLFSLFTDICNYARLAGLPRPDLAPEVHAAKVGLQRAARILPPLLRVEQSPALFACAVISPLPLLPHIVVVSAGAMEKLPPRCLVAVLAHEMGHLRHGHTQLYSWLRLLSRGVLLGPSFLNTLVKSPMKLEAQADAFAVHWLETAGRSRHDLGDALRLMEGQRVLSMLPPRLAGAIGVGRESRSDWLPTPLRRVLTGDASDFWVRRALNRWRLYHHLIFYSDLAGYVYTSLSDRLNSISKLPTSHPKL